MYTRLSPPVFRKNIVSETHTKYFLCLLDKLEAIKKFLNSFYSAIENSIFVVNDP